MELELNVSSIKDKVQNLTKEQEDFIYFKGNKSIILSSCAGSGKTFVCVHRLKELLKRGVDPKKIIFFSFTTAAVEELKSRVQNDDIKITTIHAFCQGLLYRMGKEKKISTFYDFVNWFKETHKPKESALQIDKSTFYETISNLYDDAEMLSASINSYKLQLADNIKVKVPEYFIEYSHYLKETKARDFSDMLIEVRELLKEEKWLKMFRGKFEYVFVDEMQDTSLTQMKILLSLNAKIYYLIGDRFQSIFLYAMANCIGVENLLKSRRETVEMHLTTNFRSCKSIVEYSNQYSDLKAIPFYQEEGFVNKYILNFNQYVELLENNEEIVTLVRTNAVIKSIEKRLLLKKIKINYLNYLKKDEIEEIQEGKERFSTKQKIDSILKEGSLKIKTNWLTLF